MTAVLLVCGLAASAQQPTKLKPGDILTVVTAGQAQYSGEFLIGSDGSITIQVLGRFEVAGKTAEEVEASVQRRAREFVKDAIVTVILKQELPLFVYLVSEKDPNGETPWSPGLKLRQLIARHPNLDSLDLYSAKLYSKGKPARTVDIVKLMRNEDETQNLELQPGDVLTLLPAASKPVWVVGAVNRPGQVRLKETDGISQAIALVNGVINTPFTPSQITVTLRRGDMARSRPLSDLDTGEQWTLEAGDTISVQLPKQIKVVVGGYVKKAGEITVREDSPLISAVEGAGGTSEEGTLERVLVFRAGEVFAKDLRSITQGGSEGGGNLVDGDFVYVSENKRTIKVFGFVTKPGTKLIPDSKTFRLSDALAAADGLRERGTYRGVYLLRTDENGKLVPKKFDFDRYMKNGDATQNPELRPGDIVFFNQISGTSLQDVLRVLPNLLLFGQLF